jgi:hypothetical protein
LEQNLKRLVLKYTNIKTSEVKRLITILNQSEIEHAIDIIFLSHFL